MAAAFDPQDGRRQVYSQPCAELAPDDKRADHIYHALTNWYDRAPMLATAVMAMCEAPANKDLAALDGACCKTMQEVLQVELLGRAFAADGLTVEEMAGCYHGKFLMDSMCDMVGASTCTFISREGQADVPLAGVKGRCACETCRMLLRARRRHMNI